MTAVSPEAAGAVAPSAQDWQSLFRSATGMIRDLVRYSGRRGVNAAILVALAGVLEGGGLLILVPILGIAIGQGPSGRWGRVLTTALDGVGARTQIERLAVLLAGFCALVVLRSLVLGARDMLLMRLQVGFAEDQRALVARRLAEAPWLVVSRQPHARINHALNGEVQQIANAANLLIQSGVAAFMLVFLSALAFALSPWLAAATFAVLAVGALTLGPVLLRAFRLGAEVFSLNQTLMWTSGQFLGGLKLAMSQGLQARFLADFEAGLARLSERRLEYTRRQSARRILTNAAGSVVGAVVVFLGVGVLKVQPVILVGVLVLIGRISGPIGTLQQNAQQIVQTLPAYTHLRALCRELEAASEADPPASEPPRPLPPGPVVLRGVSFGHDARRILDNLDARIEPDAFLGLRGPSGVGKTTFADLVAGLYRPQTGTVTVGGVPLEGGALAAWRAVLGYVPQEPFLLQDTVRRNLLWGVAEADEATIAEALRLTGADAVVARLPLGLDTALGERGSTLSGGERQRIAIARALLRRPRLLILDEATSAIDIEGERTLLTRLRGLSPRPAVLVIAHRNETLVLCSEVLTLEGGRFRSTDAAA